MKKRLDQLLVERDLTESREKGKRLILSGEVLVDGKILDKVGIVVDEKSKIEIKEKFPYVSRGALKLEKAYQEFRLDFKNKVICDIGSSTGGFTDFSLQNGAKKVYAIDVGYGQLDQKLRNDKRVVVMERTNIKKVNSLPEPMDFFLIDVSFISLKQVLPAVKKITVNPPCRRVGSKQLKGYKIIALIKPQFEVGKKIADKYKGVIKDSKIQKEVVDNIKNFVEDLGFKIKGITESSILGAKGNKEFLIYFYY